MGANKRSRPTGQQGDSRNNHQGQDNSSADELATRMTLTKALSYRGRGWVVVPACTDPCTVPWHDQPCSGKRPLVKIKDRNEVPSEAQVKKWWRRWPDAQLAILTGARSNLVVLDIDGPEGEASLVKLEKALGKLPRTREYITKRGRHLYLRHPGGYVLTRKGDDFKTWNGDREPAPGLDVRGDGGLVIVRSGVVGRDPVELPESWVGPLSTSATAAAELDDKELSEALAQIRTEGEPSLGELLGKIES